MDREAIIRNQVVCNLIGHEIAVAVLQIMTDAFITSNRIDFFLQYSNLLMNVFPYDHEAGYTGFDTHLDHGLPGLE